MGLSERVDRGDYIRVAPLEQDLNTPRDFGVIKGTALEAVDRVGSALGSVGFRVGLKKPVELPFNANEVDVRVLFKADVARRFLRE